MPHIAESPVTAYAHCGIPTCRGAQQQPVKAKRVETSWTFGDNGGDGVHAALTERSHVEFYFVDEGERPCPSCGKARAISGQERPSYDPLSGYDPMGLIGLPPAEAVGGGDDRIVALEAQLAAMQAMLKKLADEDAA